MLANAEAKAEWAMAQGRRIPFLVGYPGSARAPFVRHSNCRRYGQKHLASECSELKQNWTVLGQSSG